MQLSVMDKSINDLAENTGVSSATDYQSDLFVDQLDRDDTILKTLHYENAYPLSISTD